MDLSWDSASFPQSFKNLIHSKEKDEETND